MTKYKEFEIRKLVFKLFIYNSYKYKLSNNDYYALLDFISGNKGYQLKYISRVFQAALKNKLCIQSFCSSMSVYQIRNNLSRKELLDKILNYD